MQTTCLIDAHVHFYGCYDRRLFFDGAAGNFRKAAAKLGLDRAEGWLLFTETAGDHYFRQFKAEAEAGEPGGADGWRFAATADPCALKARRGDGAELTLIAGRQIVTAERLEVLALGCDRTFDDGLPLQATLDAARGAGAVAVLPWAFGKWLGARGRRVAAALETAGSAGADGFYLGDNGGRPWIMPTPTPFARAAALGIPVLPGSDPLPLAGEAGGAGRFGFVLDGGVDPARPTAGLKAWLAEQSAPLRRFGRLESLTRFCRNQIALRV